MSKIFHPFIVDFVASFQDEKFIFMVVHVIQGGELFSRVHDENADKDGLPDNQVKFYALCVADALAYLHRQGYVYRGKLALKSVCFIFLLSIVNLIYCLQISRLRML